MSAEIDDTESWNGFGPEARDIYYRLPGNVRDPREDGDRHRQLNGGPASEKKSLAYNLGLPLGRLDLSSFATYTERLSEGPGAYRGANSAQNLVEIYPDGYMPVNVIDEDDFQVSFGLAGDVANDWTWNASTSFSENEANFNHHNSLAPSFGNASPDNPIHGYTSVPTQLYIGQLTFNQWTTNVDFAGELSLGNLPTPLGASFGFEYRAEDLVVSAGEYPSYADGGYTFPVGHPRAGQRPSPGASGTGGYSPDQEVDQSRSVKAVYVDFTQQFTDRLELGLAGRFETYDDVGDSSSAKISGRYTLSDRYALRATVSNGFKAPTLQQLHYSQASATWGVLSTTGIQGINANVYSNPGHPFAVAMGSAPLSPQESTNVSFGLTGRVRSNFDFSIDVYQIDLRDRIVYQSSGDSRVTSRILADAGLIDIQDGWAYTVSYLANGVDTKTRGADLVLNYSSDFGRFGTVKWSVLSAQNRTELTRIRSVPEHLEGLITQDDFFSRNSLGVYTDLEPRNKTFLSADWRIGNLEVRPTLKHYTKVVTVSDEGPERDHVVNAAWITDLEVTYTWSGNKRLSIGGTNISGKRPEGSPPAQVPFNSQLAPNYAIFSPYGAWGAFFYTRFIWDFS